MVDTKNNTVEEVVVKKAYGGAILVGGASRRMGADKSMVHLAGKPLIEHVVVRLKPQVRSILVVGEEQSDAPNTQEFRVPDCMPGRLGPLVGVLTALEWYARERLDVKYVFVTSVDVPFLPLNVVEQLAERREGDSEIIFAKSRDQIQYLAGLWPVTTAPNLRSFLMEKRGLSIMRFVENRASTTIDFAAHEFDPFLNLNTENDLSIAEEIAAKLLSQ